MTEINKLDSNGSLYLNLLRGAVTNQIYGDAPVSPWSASHFDANVRALGQDWPSLALTMIGDARIENIRHLFETILNDGVPGDLVEAGVWRGGAVIYMRGLLKAFGVMDRVVWAADSFEGLPPPDPKIPADEGDEHHRHDILSVSMEEVVRNFQRFELLDNQIRFVKGWFKDTLMSADIGQIALLRLDCDMYGSTMDVLGALYSRMSVGGYIIVDDYGSTPNCRLAIDDFRKIKGISSPLIDIDGAGVYWRV